jgi:hypothetical protein
MRAAALVLAVFLAAAAAAAPSDADRAWSRIEQLRAGPGEPPGDAPEAAVKLARAHLAAQEQALSAFLNGFPGDPRRHEAELEYAAVSATLGASLTDRNRVDKALQRLAAMEKAESTPSRFRADAAFQRITTTMQTVNLAAAARPGETATARNTILESAQNFAANFPEDRRAARLLAEAATLFDDVPNRKRKVLQQASVLAKDDATRNRVKDDLQRLELLGQPLDLAFATTDGGKFSVAAQRGRVAVIVFWASWSPPSVAWLAELAKFSRTLPPGRVTVATVSLDRSKDSCRKMREALGIAAWPTSCEGGGWDNPVARKLRINALPTVFICDKEGRLRALNARESYASVIRQLLAESAAVTR